MCFVSRSAPGFGGPVRGRAPDTQTTAAVDVGWTKQVASCVRGRAGGLGPPPVRHGMVDGFGNVLVREALAAHAGTLPFLGDRSGSTRHIVACHDLDDIFPVLAHETAIRDGIALPRSNLRRGNGCLERGGPVTPGVTRK